MNMRVAMVMRMMMLTEYITSQGTNNHRVHFLRANTCNTHRLTLAGHSDWDNLRRED